MAKIHLPSRICEIASLESSTIHVDGNNIQEVLGNLYALNPDIQTSICDENTKSVNEYTKIFINDDDILDKEGIETKVEGNDDIYIIQAMAGG